MASRTEVSPKAGSPPIAVRILQAGLVLVLVATDLATKDWARTAEVTVHGPTNVLPFLTLVLAFNPGLAFGGMLGIAGQPLASLVLTSAISVVLAVWMLRERRTSAGFLIAFALAGALGNTIDRVLNGIVTDFLELRLGGFLLVVNLADLWIFIAVIGFFLRNTTRPARGDSG